MITAIRIYAGVSVLDDQDTDGINVAESNARYTARVEEVLQEAFPGAHVSWHAGNGLGDTIYTTSDLAREQAREQEQDDAVESVRAILESVFTEPAHHESSWLVMTED